jgi:hypothetical protein
MQAASGDIITLNICNEAANWIKQYYTTVLYMLEFQNTFNPVEVDAEVLNLWS